MARVSRPALSASPLVLRRGAAGDRPAGSAGRPLERPAERPYGATSPASGPRRATAPGRDALAGAPVPAASPAAGEAGAYPLAAQPVPPASPSARRTAAVGGGAVRLALPLRVPGRARERLGPRPPALLVLRLEHAGLVGHRGAEAAAHARRALEGGRRDRDARGRHVPRHGVHPDADAGLPLVRRPAARARRLGPHRPADRRRADD